MVSVPSGEALLIDPGANAAEIVAHVSGNALKPVAVLNTHGHYDHVGAVAELKALYGIPFYLHSKDEKLVKQVNLYRKVFDGEGFVTIPVVDYYWDNLAPPVTIGPFVVSYVHTPGHTPGGVCIQLGANLFTGDTLFRSRIGRIDLPGGNKALMRSSLEALCTLDPNLVIYPGHGKPSRLGDEVENNPELREALAS